MKNLGINETRTQIANVSTLGGRSGPEPSLLPSLTEPDSSQGITPIPLKSPAQPPLKLTTDIMDAHIRKNVSRISTNSQSLRLRDASRVPVFVPSWASSVEAAANFSTNRALTARFPLTAPLVLAEPQKLSRRQPQEPLRKCI